ncbi:MerR family transcriptional regulator [Candidatus Soleaferrea massiliensis]|uniref:MerR family transcriptional regulator n=1 Tax=Candidatus Soleaferrea massiliensis TaxID=1470354 RepID=UPI00058D7D34|nr:MerR family transcriptional regulator [Candidatus Soleaferrea massiliensis]
MNTYYTSEVARIIGIHPNTVRLYEKLQLIPAPERRANGYRIFTDFHIEQFRLARTAMQVEVLQNGLRKKAIRIIQTAAQRNFTEAKLLAAQYKAAIRREQRNAEEAIESVHEILSGRRAAHHPPLKRQETADLLGISADTLRNWEMNGLLSVKRRQNGYRVYTDSDIRRLRIIRSLRCANYSLAAILRLLHALSENPQTDLRQAINTPREDDDIISVCDRLLTSLRQAEQNAVEIQKQLDQMQRRFG